MTMTFDELLTPTTQEDELAALMGALPAGFAVESWRDGDVAKTLIEIDAQALAEATVVRTAIARGGLLDEAEGDWLALLAEQVFQVIKNLATVATRDITLTAAAAAGPYTISPGSLWMSSDDGLRFVSTNVDPLTLDKGGTLALVVSAESPGSIYNSSPVTSLVTSLAGVTVADNGTATPGTDDETDAALRSRCRNRWPALGTGSPAGAYDLWAKSASSSVTRTKVAPSGTVAGGVDVYLAGASGGVDSPVVTAVATYIAARAPLGSVPNVASATNSAQALTAVLHGKAQYETAALAASEAAFRALIAATDIGGTIYQAAKIEALMSADGVENATISVGAADVTLSATQVATAGTIAITWSNT